MRHNLLLFLTAGNIMLQLQLLLGRDTNLPANGALCICSVRVDSAKHKKGVHWSMFSVSVWTRRQTPKMLCICELFFAGIFVLRRIAYFLLCLLSVIPSTGVTNQCSDVWVMTHIYTTSGSRTTTWDVLSLMTWYPPSAVTRTRVDIDPVTKFVTVYSGP